MPLEVCYFVGDTDADRCDERPIRLERKARGNGQVRGDYCVQLKRPVSKYIPADRCLAGLNVLVRGGRWRAEGGGGGWEWGRPSEGIKEGHAIPPPTPSFLHWSGNDRFHSCFRSWRRGSGVGLSGWGLRMWCGTKSRMRGLCGSSQRSTVSSVMFAKQRPNSFCVSHRCTESRKNKRKGTAARYLHQSVALFPSDCNVNFSANFKMLQKRRRKKMQIRSTDLKRVNQAVTVKLRMAVVNRKKWLQTRRDHTSQENGVRFSGMCCFLAGCNCSVISASTGDMLHAVSPHVPVVASWHVFVWDADSKNSWSNKRGKCRKISVPIIGLILPFQQF